MNKKVIKRSASFGIAFLMLLSSAGALPGAELFSGSAVATAEAASAVVCNANELTPFKNRTRQEVAERYSQAMMAGDTYINNDSLTYYNVRPSFENPYYQGIVSDDTLEVMQVMTDYYRWLAGSEELAEKCTQDESLQYQALDRNYQFAHYISNSSKPADMPDELWQMGFECNHNILARGYSPRDAISGWMNEGYSLSSRSWNTTGHRYALIRPDHTGLQFGYCGNVAIGAYSSAVRNKPCKDTLIAYPSPGAFPAEAIPRPAVSVWSVDWDTSAFSFNISDVTVTITNLGTGVTFVRTAADDTLTAAADGLRFVQAEDYNTSTQKYEGSYKITITGLKDADSKDAVIEYTVDFFNASETAASRVRSFSLIYDTVHIHSSWDNEEGLARLACALPTTVTVVTDFGSKYTVPVAGKWVYKAEDKCFHNTVDKSQLPSVAIDSYGVLDDIKISYDVDDDACEWFYLRTTPANTGSISDGTSIAFNARRYVSSYTSTTICRVTTDENGKESGTIVYDTVLTPDALTNGTSNPVVFTNPSARVTDSGQYFFLSYHPLAYWNDAYLSERMISVNIVHNYTSAVTKEPTCTRKGERTYTCSGCGDTYTEDIPPNGHHWEDTQVDPTCTEQGYTIHYCPICKTEERDTYVKELGHNYISVITKSATCTEDGLCTCTCSRCSDSYTAVIQATGHKFDEKVTEPTCTEPGCIQRTCSICKATETIENAPPTGHSYEIINSKAVTCTEDGFETYVCSDCGDTYTDILVAEGHKFHDEVIAPTCTEPGCTRHTCTVCNYTEEEDYVDALGHKWSSKVTAKPTCTENGVRTYTCSKCHDSYEEVIEAEGHLNDDSVIEPTCTAKGYTLHKCSKCGYERRDTFVDPLGHSFEEVVTTEPTCTKTGLLTRTCTRCKHSETEIIPAAGHRYEDTVIPPTLTDEGYTIHYCPVCKDEYWDTFVPPGKPVCSLTVNAIDPKYSSQTVTVTFSAKGTEDVTVTAEDGQFTLPDLPDGAYTMTVRAQYFVSFSCEVSFFGGAAQGLPEIKLDLFGDLSGDGKVNMRDYALLQRHLVRPGAVSISEVCADLNSDGKVNMRDYALMQKYLAGAKIDFKY